MAAWVLWPAFGAGWAWYSLRRSYYFYDEWSMISRVVHSPASTAMTASFNGHLWIAQYWIYRLQVSWFGLNDHVFVSVAFIVSLVALHLSLSALWRSVGWSTPASLVFGGLLTYLGVASQNFVFAVQASPTLATAACIAATAVALARPPTLRRSLVVGSLLVVAVGLDSGAALIGFALASVVMVASWRDHHVLAAVPAAIALMWWYTTADLGPSFPAPLGDRIAFACHLLLRSIGGLTGLGEVAGVVMVTIAVVVLGVGLRARTVHGKPLALLLGGLLSTFVVIGAIAQSRAGLDGFNFVDFNRYLQNVAIPVAACVPACATAIAALIATPRPDVARPAIVAAALRWTPTVALLVAFGLGVEPARSYAAGFESWNVATRRGIEAATRIVVDGCPEGTDMIPDAQPLGGLSPQVTTQLVRDLLDRGALDVAPPATHDRAIEARMCSQSPVAGGQPSG